MVAITLEGPIDLLAQVVTLRGIEAGRVEPVDESTDILHGPANERIQKASLIIGLITALLTSADAAIMLADHIFEYVQGGDDQTIKVIDPTTGHVIVEVDSSTSKSDIRESLGVKPG